jgi:cytidylate kinase
MPENLSQFPSFPTEEAALPLSPQHGYRGDRGQGQPFLPAGLTIALSREAGSRGTTIAQLAGEKLGWQVYTQEMLEYLAQAETARQEITETLTAGMAHWVEERMEQLHRKPPGDWSPALFEMARLILSLGAGGEVVLIGRGAGCILPRHSTLHVRVIAQDQDRVAYMAQWLRLTPEEAADQMRARDLRRADYLRSHFHRDASDVYQFDLLLNSTLLGVELSAELLVQAARAKLTGLVTDRF